jgi:hypothetical protein
MRRQHQVVAFAAPSHMVAESSPVGGLAFFPLDRYIFVESGHSLSSGKAFYSSRSANQKETGTTFTVQALSSPPEGAEVVRGD